MKFYRSGPWKGQRTHIATSGDKAQYAELLRNLYVRDSDQAPVAISRPGFELVGSQLASGGKGQFVGQFTEQDGTEHSIAIAGGKFYKYDWGTDTFSETISAANFSSASITVSTTARIYAVPFAGEMVFSDGVNTAWSWDGTAGGGLTKLTGVPVFYGQPWVYNGHLFAICGTSTATRISVMWSEVGDATLGYGVSPYDANIWDVFQTSQAIFYAGTATNEDIVLCRANSTTRLVGDPADNFQSTAQREGVHEFVGTLSPASMLVHQDIVYYMANDGRIMRVQPGGAADEIAIGVREYMSKQAVAKLGVVDAQVWDAGASGEYLLWIIANTASDSPNTVLVVDPRSGELVGQWDGWIQDRWGTWKDSNGVSRLVHIGGADAATATSGYVYVHGIPTGAVWTDGFQAGAAAVYHSVQTHAMGYDETTEKHWDIANVSALVPSNLTSVSVQIRTPYGLQPPQVVNALVGGGTSWNQANWNAFNWADPGKERQLSAGLDHDGRWAMLTVNHNESGEQIAIQSVVARAFVLAADPLIA